MGEPARAGDTWVPKPPSDRTFAGRLQLLRLHLDGISQREAAERCGINRATWSAWEANPDRSPRNVNEIARQVHDTFGVDLHWLAFGPESLNVHEFDSQASLLLSSGEPAFNFGRTAAGFVLAS